MGTSSIDKFLVINEEIAEYSSLLLRFYLPKNQPFLHYKILKNSEKKKIETQLKNQCAMEWAAQVLWKFLLIKWENGEKLQSTGTKEDRKSKVTHVRRKENLRWKSWPGIQEARFDRRTNVLDLIGSWTPLSISGSL